MGTVGQFSSGFYVAAGYARRRGCANLGKRTTEMKRSGGSLLKVCEPIQSEKCIIAFTGD
jgi:hypothetical protein